MSIRGQMAYVSEKKTRDNFSLMNEYANNFQDKKVICDFQKNVAKA